MVDVGLVAGEKRVSEVQGFVSTSMIINLQLIAANQPADSSQSLR